MAAADRRKYQNDDRVRYTLTGGTTGYGTIKGINTSLPMWWIVETDQPLEGQPWSCVLMHDTELKPTLVGAELYFIVREGELGWVAHAKGKVLQETEHRVMLDTSLGLLWVNPGDVFRVWQDACNEAARRKANLQEETHE